MPRGDRITAHQWIFEATAGAWKARWEAATAHYAARWTDHGASTDPRGSRPEYGGRDKRPSRLVCLVLDACMDLEGLAGDEGRDERPSRPIMPGAEQIMTHLRILEGLDGDMEGEMRGRQAHYASRRQDHSASVDIRGHGWGMEGKMGGRHRPLCLAATGSQRISGYSWPWLGHGRRDGKP